MQNAIKEKIVKAIRVLTVPPLLASVFLVIVKCTSASVFAKPLDFIMSIVFLGAFPLLAYGVWAIVPKLKNGGRNTQRRLAFVFSLVGYIALWVYSRIAKVNREMSLICDTYFFSVLLLSIINFVFKIKASGHACGISGPLLLSVHFMGWVSAFPCLALGIISFWASVKSGRHTLKQLFAGTLTAAAAFSGSLIKLHIMM